MLNISETPRTDAKLLEMDMQDLEFGHKFRELKEFTKGLERELSSCQEKLKEFEIKQEKIAEALQLSL